MHQKLRECRRKEQQFPIVIDYQDYPQIAQVVNFSAKGGLFSMPGNNLPRDGLFKFTIDLTQNKSITGLARVVSCSETGEVAFVYDHIGHEEYELLEILLKEASH